MQSPILMEIVKNAFATAAEEMGVAVVRGAYSTMTKEAGDASAAIFDGEGRLVSQALGIPLMHLSSLRCSMGELLKDFPPERIDDGDVFLFNDPYRGGIHANDVMIFKPLFFDKRLSFFTGTLMHVADLGGLSSGGLPANASDIFQEGLLLPPLKFYEAGKINETLIKVIQANSRTPIKAMGDIRAMLGAVNIGARRVGKLVEKYGLEELSGLARDLMDYSERCTRMDIQGLPRGAFEGSFLIDDDGIDATRRYQVRVSVQLDGSTVLVDFTGTDPQARGPINATFSQSMSAVIYAIRCFLDPTTPMNEGCFRPFKVILPYGTLVNPRPPAPFNAKAATRMGAIESIITALSKACPDKAVAGSCINHVFTMSGRGVAGSEHWTYIDTDFGGVGARCTKDGVDAFGPLISAGGSGGVPVEAIECEYPVLYQRYQLWTDSGGPGKWRGGLGLIREVKVLAPAEATVRADRVRYPPKGMAGGKPGRAGGWVIGRGTSEEVSLPSKKTGVALEPGQVLTMLTSGGGGFGQPWERSTEFVLEDYRQGKVSLEGASRDYGVQIDPMTSSIDYQVTERLRQAMANANGGIA